jgi:ATP-binding protein involved in chromosome partitioning
MNVNPNESHTQGRTPGDDMDAFLNQNTLHERLKKIRHKVLVLSGKGGVGKSTVAVNLAASLSAAGKRVGLLDVDIHGPSVPKMLHLENTKVEMTESGIVPLEKDGLKVMSLGFLIPNPDDAVIWRGPVKIGVIEQFLRDVNWGELDYLIIDSPPGTGDEPLSVCQLVKNPDGAVIVTTPQDVATSDVRRSITFCHRLELPVLGVVENMSGFVCPKCGEITNIFKTGGGERMAHDMGVPFLGRIPLDPAVDEAGDAGQPFVRNTRTETAKIFEEIAAPILSLSQ